MTINELMIKHLNEAEQSYKKELTDLLVGQILKVTIERGEGFFKTYNEEEVKVIEISCFTTISDCVTTGHRPSLDIIVVDKNNKAHAINYMHVTTDSPNNYKFGLVQII